MGNAGAFKQMGWSLRNNYIFFFGLTNKLQIDIYNFSKKSGHSKLKDL